MQNVRERPRTFFKNGILNGCFSRAFCDDGRRKTEVTRQGLVIYSKWKAVVELTILTTIFVMKLKINFQLGSDTNTVHMFVFFTIQSPLTVERTAALLDKTTKIL